MPNTELLPKSNPESVRRLEVFTGAGRRRTWTAEQKARIVAESCEGKESVCAVARRHGLTPQQLFGWRRQARRRAEAEASGAAFVLVIVEAAGRRAEVALAPAPTDRSSTIEIVIGAATVRVPPGIDPVILTTVLRATRAAI